MKLILCALLLLCSILLATSGAQQHVQDFHFDYACTKQEAKAGTCTQHGSLLFVITIEKYGNRTGHDVWFVHGRNRIEALMNIDPTVWSVHDWNEVRAECPTWTHPAFDCDRMFPPIPKELK